MDKESEAARMTGARLGLGLLSIGREWGYVKNPVPSAEQSDALLRAAVDAGIKFLDTAASYGRSEERLGEFLRNLEPGIRGGLVIATKAGEHWNPETGSLYVDHSYDALVRSIDRSIGLLGKVDLLQLHKASMATVTDDGVRAALEHAKASGVGEIGASVTDLETANLVLADELFQAIQFPFHLNNRRMEPIFEAAARAGKRVLINRPFGMGELIYEKAHGENAHRRRVRAFEAILERMSYGVILTGTGSVDHLRENIQAFQEARVKDGVFS